MQGESIAFSPRLRLVFPDLVTRIRNHALNLLLGALLAWVFAAHCAHYWPYLSDDALISLRYAERFAGGLGLTWTDGERVEGYSDLLWVLLTSIGPALSIDAIWTARVLGIVGGFTAVVALGYSTSMHRFSVARQISGALLLALSAPLAVWSIGGLEHGFMMGVLAVGLVLATPCFGPERPPAKQILFAGLPFAALALLRADGAVLLAALLMGTLGSRTPWRQWPARVTLLSAPAAISLLAQLAFRRLYYDEWVPNTALVKVSLTEARFDVGVQHVTQGMHPIALLITLALVSSVIALVAGKRATIAMPLAVWAGWFAYVGAVGGDIFPAWRQLSLGLVPLAWLVAECAEILAPKDSRGVTATIVGFLVLGLAHYRLQVEDKENQRGVSERWPLEGEGMGLLLRKAFGEEKPLLAVDAAGALPYWSRLPALDMLGLNDHYLPRHPPPTFGGRAIGHDLGDGDYVWERSPDILAFNNSVGSKRPLFYSGVHMMRKPGFHRRYQVVRLRGLPPTRPYGEMHFKKSDGPLAIRYSAEEIQIPGYFAASDGRLSIAELGPDNRLEVALLPQSPALVPDLLLPAGTWQLVTDPPEAAQRAAFHCGARSAIRQRSDVPPTLLLQRQQSISILLSLSRTLQRRVALRELRLVRKDSATPSFTCPSPVGPIELGPNAIARQGFENDDWEQPEHFVFTGGPLHIDLGSVRHGHVAEVSVDNNDVYQFDFLLSGNRVHTARVDPVQNGGGMAVHKLSLPNELIESGFDAVDVQATGGDRRFSLGHIRVLD